MGKSLWGRPNYNTLFQPHTETWVSHDQELNVVLTREYDPLGRSEGFGLSGGYEVTYGYTPQGRFASVSNTFNAQTHLAEYNYQLNSHLISGYTLGDLERNIAFEAKRNLVDTITNTWDSTTTLSAFEYTNDKAGRRTHRDDSGIAFASTQQNVFGYNVRSEVTSASMRNGTSSYNFDQIGNRITISTPDEPNPVSYLANALNQYTAIENGAPVNPVHDFDGNLIDDGDGTTFEWNGENRNHPYTRHRPPARQPTAR